MAEAAVAAGWEEVEYFDMSYALEKKEKETSLTYTSPKKKLAKAAVAASWEEVEYFDTLYPLEKKKKISHTYASRKKIG